MSIYKVHNARKILEVAFGNVLGDSSYTYTDISPWHKDEPYSFKRGRQNELQQFDAGDGSAVLVNNDRRFEALYSSGAYYPNVDLQKPVRLSLEYPWLPGVLADGAFNDGIGEWGIANGAVTLAWLPNGGWLYIGADALRITCTASTNPNVQTNPYFDTVPGETWYLSMRVKSSATRNIQVGINWLTAGGGAISSSTASAVSCPAGQWTRLELAVTAAPATTGHCRPFISWTGGVNGDTVDVSHVVFDQVSWSTSSTAQQLGYADDWQPYWALGDNKVVLKWHDGFKPLGLKNISNKSYDALIASQGWIWYWPMDDPYGSAFIRDVRGQQLDLVPYGSPGPILGTPGPSIVDPGTSLDFYNGGGNPGAGWLNLGDDVAFTAGTAWSGSVWFNVTELANRFFQQGPSTDIRTAGGTGGLWNYWNLYLNSDGTFGFGGHDLNDNTLVFNTLNTSVYDGLWHFLTMAIETNCRDVHIYLDGVELHAVNVLGGSINPTYQNWKATTAMNFSTTRFLVAGANDADPAYPGRLAKLAMWWGQACSIAQHQALYNLGVPKWSGQTLTQRAGQILDAGGWPAWLRNLDTISTVANDEVTTLTQTKQLEYLRALEASDGGWCYMDRDGMVRIISRANLEKAPYTQVQYVLSDRGGETDTPTGLIAVPYESVSPAFNDAVLFNEDTEARQIDATTTGPNMYASDATSEAKYFNLTFPQKGNIKLATDLEALALAQWNVAYYKDPKMVFSAVTINCFEDAVWKMAINAKIGNRVAILVHPFGGGAAIRVEAIIQGLSGSGQRGQHKITYQLGIVPPDVLLMDDSVRGKLDSGNKLGY